MRTPVGSPVDSATDLWVFLLFSHGWTWLFWAIAVAMGMYAMSMGSFGIPGVPELLI